MSDTDLIRTARTLEVPSLVRITVEQFDWYPEAKNLTKADVSTVRAIGANDMAGSLVPMTEAIVRIFYDCQNFRSAMAAILEDDKFGDWAGVYGDKFRAAAKAFKETPLIGE